MGAGRQSGTTRPPASKAAPLDPMGIQQPNSPAPYHMGVVVKGPSGNAGSTQAGVHGIAGLGGVGGVVKHGGAGGVEEVQAGGIGDALARDVGEVCTSASANRWDRGDVQHPAGVGVANACASIVNEVASGVAASGGVGGGGMESGASIGGGWHSASEYEPVVEQTQQLTRCRRQRWQGR